MCRSAHQFQRSYTVIVNFDHDLYVLPGKNSCFKPVPIIRPGVLVSGMPLSAVPYRIFVCVLRYAIQMLRVLRFQGFHHIRQPLVGNLERE